MGNTKLYHFYHIYADGDWYVPVSQHLTALKKWDLINNLSALKVGIVGTPENRTNVIQYLTNKIIFDVVSEQDEGWEQATQIPLHAFSLINNGYILYAHSKGAANISKLNNFWRKSMTFYNVGQWQKAVEKLDEGFDAVGQHWMYPPPYLPDHEGTPFFGGTFWWTSLAHIRELGKPTLENRHIAEDWIGQQHYNKPMKCFDFTGHISAHPDYSLWSEETQNWVGIQ